MDKYTLISWECLGGCWELEALELLDYSSLAKLSSSSIPHGLAPNSSWPDWQITIVAHCHFNAHSIIQQRPPKPSLQW